jgi:hypothetical protein
MNVYVCMYVCKGDVRCFNDEYWIIITILTNDGDKYGPKS